jgi:amino acid transporter
MLTLTGADGAPGLIAGSFLAFYAFIGFEDIVNVADEVKMPEKNLPRAIVLSLIVATCVYFTVSTVSIISVPPSDLAATQAPLALVVASGGHSGELIALISLLAVTNGALIQVVMASRVLYGMADQGLIWRGFARINAHTQTPLTATVLVAVAITALALLFSLGALARYTSALALLIFAIVNASLLRLKAQTGEDPPFSVPGIIPTVALLACLVMLVQDQYSRFF